MPLITKPDFTYVWASGGAIVAPNDTKKQLGWVAEAPPFQYDNWLQNRQDQMLAHINQRGIPAWDGLTNYEAGGLSYVQGSDGKVYKSVAASGPASVTSNPTTDGTDTYWTEAFASIGAFLTQAAGDARYTQRANNLSDVTNAVTARTNLGAAPIVSPLFTGNPAAPTPPQFDSSKKLATTEFVQRALGNFQSSYSQTVTATLTAENAGAICNAFNSITLTLPLSTAVPVGATYKINNTGAGVVSVVANAGNSLYAVGNGTPRSFNLQSGDELTIAYVGGNTWYAWGSGQLGFSLGAFGASLASAGYQKLPSGLIIQWGVAGGGTGTRTFPIAFPTAFLSIALACQANDTSGVTGTPSVTGFSYAGANGSRYIALGY